MKVIHIEINKKQEREIESTPPRKLGVSKKKTYNEIFAAGLVSVLEAKDAK